MKLLLERGAGTFEGLSWRSAVAQRRRRILEVACQAFGQRGFEGTHIREICELACANPATVYYYFRDKQGLYEAVQTEAREQLFMRSGCGAAAQRKRTPEEEFRATVESLLAKLSRDSGWIARLLVWELSDKDMLQSTVGKGLRNDSITLKAVFREVLSPEANESSVHLKVLNVIALCVFYCVAGEKLRLLLPELGEQGTSAASLARHLTHFALRPVSDAQIEGKVYEKICFSKDC
jgi:AcrR family transcriptional regulator